MSDLITQFRHVLGHRLIRNGQADALTDGSSDADGLHTHASKATKPVPRNELATESYAVYPLNFQDWSNYDGVGCGVVGRLWTVNAGTPPQAGPYITVFGGNSWKVRGPAVEPGGSDLWLIGQMIALPPEYVPGGAGRFVFRIGWFPDNGGGSYGADLARLHPWLRKLDDGGNSEANLLTPDTWQTFVENGSELTWDITTAGLAPGDRFLLWINMSLDATPDEDESIHVELGNAELQCDIRG